MTLPRILIIDDQYADSLDEQELVKDIFSLRGDGGGLSPQLGSAVFFSGLTAGKFDVDASLKEVEKGWKDDVGSARWALVIVDYYFVEPAQQKHVAGGKHVVQAIKAKYRDVPVALFSTKDPRAVEVDVVDGVAFLQKPKLRGRKPEPQVQADLRRKFYRILMQHGLFPDETVRYVDTAGAIRMVESTRRPMVGCSLPFLKTLRDSRASLLNKPLTTMLIHGPEGSGKDELVEYIHDWGEALGHSRNQDALTDRVAKAERASLHVGEMTGLELVQVTADKLGEKLNTPTCSTLHVDPIECLPEPSQRFVTRWIEEQIGSGPDGSNSVLARLIFTSSQTVQGLIEHGQIVSNLIDQLDVIEVPGVYDRRGALELLEHFLTETFAARAALELNAGSKEPPSSDPPPKAPALTPDAIEAVDQETNWPGNVRQIRRLAMLLVARNEFRRSITADEIRACIAKTSSFRVSGTRSGVRGLIDRITAQTIGDNERLDGVFKELRVAGSELVRRILLREAVKQRYTIQRVARVLLDDDTLENWAPYHRLKEWRDFFDIKGTGDSRLDAMLAKRETTTRRQK
jgi:DNA-binding NtrC family response regulator